MKKIPINEVRQPVGQPIDRPDSADSAETDDPIATLQAGH